MRSRARRLAHVMERTGLAMVGATCGLLVAVHVGSSMSALTSQGFILLMLVVGAAAFYLGIDTPPLPFHETPPGLPAAREKIDVAEFLSAAGTFLAALAAICSMIVIAFREAPHIAATMLIMAGWVVGVTMQIGAGAIARIRS
ncbi:hypothetical protein BH11PSE4_BH11PSE4_15870 [soil metagenome]